VDSNTRGEYEAFCDALGAERGTEQYEQWVNRDKPTPLVEAVESAAPESEQSEDSKPQNQTFEVSKDLDLGEWNESGDSEIGLEAVNLLLSVENLKVVSSTGGVDSPSVTYLDSGGFNQIRVSGLYGGGDIFFKLDTGEIVDSEMDCIESVRWINRPEENLIQFESVVGESVTVDINPDEPEKPLIEADSDTDTDRETGRIESLESEISSPVDQLKRFLLFVHHAGASASLTARVGVFVVWFVVAISSFLTSFGTVFWLLMVAPVRQFGPWALGTLTAYKIGASVLSVGLPVGNVALPSVVGALLLSTGYLATTTSSDQ